MLDSTHGFRHFSLSKTAFLSTSSLTSWATPEARLSSDRPVRDVRAGQRRASV